MTNADKLKIFNRYTIDAEDYDHTVNFNGFLAAMAACIEIMKTEKCKWTGDDFNWTTECHDTFNSEIYDSIYYAAQQGMRCSCGKIIELVQ